MVYAFYRYEQIPDIGIVVLLNVTWKLEGSKINDTEKKIKFLTDRRSRALLSPLLTSSRNTNFTQIFLKYS